MTSTDPCLLASTGAPLTHVWLLAVGLLAVAGAVFLLRASRGSVRAQRTTRLLGGGAIVLIACLTLSPAMAPTVAHAATTTNSCTTGDAAPAPAPADPDDTSGDAVEPPAEIVAVEVEPIVPTLPAVPCDEIPEVVIPVVEGVVYEQTQSGDTVTVTARPADGFVFAAGVTTTWTFTTAIEPCSCTPNGIVWPEVTTRTYYSLWEDTLTARSTTWAQTLVDQGATFSVHATETSHLEGYWYSETGLPEGVEDGLVIFDGVIESTGDQGQLMGENLMFAVASTGTSAYMLQEQARIDLNERYPEAAPIYFIWDSQYGIAAAGTITASITDSCGTVQAREYPIVTGGGGGNN